MATPAHKGNTKRFDQLTFNDQARSITVMVNNLCNAIKRHAKERPKAKAKCVKQVYKFLGRLLD